VVAEASGSKLNCTPARAVPSTIEAVQTDYKAWSGRCVSLSGILIRNHLYADRQAVLEPRAGWGKDVRHTIVLYDRNRIWSRRKPATVKVIGIIGSCADQNAAIEQMQLDNPNEIIMVSGYCHTSLETYIETASLRIISYDPIPRLVEAEVPVEGRELVEAPLDHPGRVEHVAAARAMVEALVTGNEETFRRLSRPEVQHDIDGLDGKPMPDWLKRNMHETHARFSDMKALRRRFAAVYPFGSRQERIFINRDDLQAVGNESYSQLIACWCTAVDCSGRWPIMTLDADNNSKRPYLCLQANDYVIFRQKDPAIQVEVASEQNGFAEPNWR
jgi:hypothetical protein